MNITHGLPQSIETGGLVLALRTGATYWIWLTSRLQQVDEKCGLNLLQQAVTQITRSGKNVDPWDLTSDEAKAVMDRVVWFMRGGIDDAPEPENSKSKEKLLDFTQDIAPLCSAFQQSYNIDLYQTQPNEKPLIDAMHWWKFLALADNLPAGSMLVDYYMHYRAMDVSILPSKTAADKKNIMNITDIKRRVALDRPKQRTRPTEKSYYRRVRELKNEAAHV